MDVDEELAQHRGQLRKKILEGLVSLAASDRQPGKELSYRVQAENLVQELAKIDKAIAEAKPKNHLRFAKCEEPIDAIVLFLKELQRPATRQEIVDGVVEGGLFGGKSTTPGRVRASITLHLNASKGRTPNAGKDTGSKIKEFDSDLIGLHEWDESTFRVIPIR